MHDDWSYIHTAQLLTQTGHVEFNGWGAPLLGIELLFGAAFIKLFGFSFTIVRLSTVLVGLITTALLQRTLVRCGIREFNASVGTITLMLSPIMLPLITGFLTDPWCLLAIIFCIYGCVRTLSAANENEAAAWISLAALGNAILGTSRQIAWLGLLLMVPATLWLCRRSRKVLVSGIVSFAAGGLILLGSMTWFAHHVYTLPEHLRLSHFRTTFHHMAALVRPILEVPSLLLPILLMFVPSLPGTNRKSRQVVGVGFALVCMGALYEASLHKLHEWLAPFVIEHGSIFGPQGVYYMWPAWGARPPTMPVWLRAGLSLATFVGVLGWLAVAAGKNREPIGTPGNPVVSFRQLAYLLVPFSIGYVLLLIPRALLDATIDRYLLPLIMVALIFLLREYQDRVRPQLPVASLVLALIMAAYSVVTLQDAFGAYRAVAVAGKELQDAGIPRTQFDGGWEYDGLTQVDVGGYVHQTGIRMPPGQTLLFGHRRTGPCENMIDVWLPDVEPAYTLSYNSNGCGGATRFAPVTYHRLLWPHTITLYVVKDPDDSGKHGLFSSF